MYMYFIILTGFVQVAFSVYCNLFGYKAAKQTCTPMHKWTKHVFIYVEIETGYLWCVPNILCVCCLLKTNMHSSMVRYLRSIIQEGAPTRGSERCRVSSAPIYRHQTEFTGWPVYPSLFRVLVVYFTNIKHQV